MNLFLNQTPDIFAQHETNLDDSTDSGNFSVEKIQLLMCMVLQFM